MVLIGGTIAMAQMGERLDPDAAAGALAPDVGQLRPLGGTRRRRVFASRAAVDAGLQERLGTAKE